MGGGLFQNINVKFSILVLFITVNNKQTILLKLEVL